MTAREQSHPPTPCRVAIAGGKPLAVAVLSALAADPAFRVVGVIPRRNDEADQAASLARRACQLGVPIFGGGERLAAAEVAAVRPHVVVSIFYDRIFRAHMIAIPPLGILNLHFGLLPEYRGNRPIPWAMVNGDPSGMTLHFVDEGIDSGNIIRRAEVPVHDHDTAETVYRRATELGLPLLLEGLAELTVGTAPRCPQDPTRAWYYRKGEPYDRWIDWQQSATAVDRFVRALWFPPFPAARTRLGNAEIEICPPLRILPASGSPGRVLAVTEGLVVAAGVGAVEITRTRRDGTIEPARHCAHAVGLGPGDRLEGQAWRLDDWRQHDSGRQGWPPLSRPAPVHEVC